MKKFNFKLTASVVSLFITFIFFVFGNKNKICLFFGFMFLAAALIMFLLYILDRFNADLIKAEEMLDELDTTPEKEEYIINLDLKYAIIKKRRKALILFSLCAGLLVICGILMLF